MNSIVVLSCDRQGAWWLDDDDAEAVAGPFASRDAALQYARRHDLTVQIDRADEEVS